MIEKADIDLALKMVDDDGPQSFPNIDWAADTLGQAYREIQAQLEAADKLADTVKGYLEMDPYLYDSSLHLFWLAYEQARLRGGKSE